VLGSWKCNGIGLAIVMQHERRESAGDVPVTLLKPLTINLIKE
jgi:hypothetical protein